MHFKFKHTATNIAYGVMDLNFKKINKIILRCIHNIRYFFRRSLDLVGEKCVNSGTQILSFEEIVGHIVILIKCDFM